MIKVSPTYSTGFNFVQISSLPYDQQLAFSDWIPASSISTIEINNISLPDCVAYQEYNYWFECLFLRIGGMLESSF
ncbi:MAG: hypothetical protein ACJAT1_000404 [Marivirga sp.]|jgi:hypothetical protein